MIRSGTTSDRAYRPRVSASQDVDDLAVRPGHPAEHSRLLQRAAGLVDRLARSDAGPPGKFVVIERMTAQAQRLVDALAVGGPHTAKDASTRGAPLVRPRVVARRDGVLSADSAVEGADLELPAAVVAKNLWARSMPAAWVPITAPALIGSGLADLPLAVSAL